MVQVALALVLLTGAGLLLRSFVAFVSLDRGFEVTADVRVDRPASVYRRGGRRIEPDAIDARNAELRQANEALLLQMERIENLPGVAAVALSSGRPLNSANSKCGRSRSLVGRRRATSARSCGPAYGGWTLATPRSCGSVCGTAVSSRTVTGRAARARPL